MVSDKIIIRGARVHNLKNITVEVPKNKFIVITGLSGSGKSSLAFDTLYAEAQRRYVESLSSYARHFLGVMQKPDVDAIEGLTPAIAIQPRTIAKNPRSIVGTVTEIYDYMRVLFARVGTPYCYKCGREISSQTIDQIVDKLLNLPMGTKFMILSPLVRGKKGEYRDLFDKIARKGFIRVRVDGTIYELDMVPTLDKNKKHNIEIVVDRLIIKPDIRSRLADSIEIAVNESNGLVIIHLVDQKRDLLFGTKFSCPYCGVTYGEIEPRLFSFNSPFGACQVCKGLGTTLDIDPELVVNPDLNIYEGAIRPWGPPGKWLRWHLHSLSQRYRVDLHKPFGKLPEKIQKVILYGDEFFEGVRGNLLRRYHETESNWIREEIERYMVFKPCPACNGTRLRPEALSIKIAGKNIAEITDMSLDKAYEFFDTLKLEGVKAKIAQGLIKEIKRRLKFLIDVGLSYLTLSRRIDTLSGGEEERVRLATQIGSGLVGVLYVLDEPSIGLHPRDNHRLLDALKNLRDMGNTVVVVEHDRDTIMSADWVIDLGPGAGEQGGHVVVTGTPTDIMKCKESLTGQYLAGIKEIPIPTKRRRPYKGWLIIKGARHNNLKNITVKIPLGLFTVITGVSGSGKSSLINDTLYKALARHFYNSRDVPGEYDEIIGLDKIDKVINIDQSPIGRTPRSNPATYTSAFTPIRQFFAELKESRKRGYTQSRFSFNLPGGRCEACRGEGLIRVEMHFLPDIFIPCEVCKGTRYNRETLEVKYKGKNIADVLNMSVDEAYEFFKDIPAIKRKLQLLKDVGLGYIKLGQPATTLSGGEAQRVKLARELSKIGTGNTLYLLDEPTTGLHFEDVLLLLKVLDRLVNRGNTVVVIEHNPEVVKYADWIIDLGPEGGDEGGEVVVAGPPEEVAKHPTSHTAAVLRRILGTEARRPQPVTIKR